MLTIEAYPLACPSRAALVDRALAGDPEARASVVGAVLSELALRHPGHPNQKVHGRRKGAPTAVAALDGPASDSLPTSGWARLSARGKAVLDMENAGTDTMGGDIEREAWLAARTALYERRSVGERLVYRDKDGTQIEIMCPSVDPVLRKGMIEGVDAGMKVAMPKPGTRVLVDRDQLDEGTAGQTTWNNEGEGYVRGPGPSHVYARAYIAMDLTSGATMADMRASHSNGFHPSLRDSSEVGVVRATTAHEYAHVVDASYGDGRMPSTLNPGTGIHMPLSASYGEAVSLSTAPVAQTISGYGVQRGPVEAFADAFSAVATGDATPEMATAVAYALGGAK